MARFLAGTMETGELGARLALARRSLGGPFELGGDEEEPPSCRESAERELGCGAVFPAEE